MCRPAGCRRRVRARPMDRLLALTSLGSARNCACSASGSRSRTRSEVTLATHQGQQDVTPFAPYVEGQTYHVDYYADFGLGTVAVSLDNMLMTTIPLLNPGTGDREIFIFQNGVGGVSN